MTSGAGNPREAGGQKKNSGRNERVYDFDMLMEKKLSAGARNKTAIGEKYLQPTIAEEPEKIRAEKKKALAELAEKRENEKKNVHIVKASGQTRQPILGLIVAAVICTALFAFMMWTSAEINESTQAISELQSRLATLSSQEKELNLQLELKNDLRVIEEKASLEYGMIKSDNLTKQHVNIDNQDKIEVVEEEEQEESTFSTMMSIIGENFSNLLEYIY